MAKIWTYNDFLNKEDFFEKVRNKEIKVGDHFKGRIVSILPNNAGVLVAICPDTNFGYRHREFPGIIPRREIDRETFENIEDVVNVGDELELEILNFDLDRERVSLSRKSLMPPIEDVDTSEPIDNSNVNIKGEKKVYIHPISDVDGKKKNQVNILKQYIREFEQRIGKGKLSGEDEIAKAKYIIDKVFKVGFSHKIYISNKSFKKNEKYSRRIAIRIPRVPGDIIDTELNIPISENIVFEGVVLYGKEISINKIFIVAEEEKLPYETDCKVEICNSSSEIKEYFLNETLDKMKSIYEYTEERLKEWEEYLDWKETISELQIRGCKYIDVKYEYDSDNKKKLKLIFTMISKSKEEFEKIKNLLRVRVKSYRNSYSKNAWEFVFDKNIDIRKMKEGEDLGYKDRNSIDEFYLMGNEDKVFDNTNNEISLNEIHDYFGDNPYIAKIAYDLSDNDKDYIQEQNLEGNDLYEYVEKEVLPKYPKSGFLAVSAVGEFALIKRFKNAIKQLKEGEHFSPRLTEWLFDTKYAREPEKKDIIKESDLNWYNKNIESDNFQKEAIIKMLQAPDLFLLQGPPGTGKTTVIVEAICQLVKQNKRVLLTSQSNDAVDNAFERLAKINNLETRALRIGISNKKNKKFKNSDEESALKYSEDTALKSYYESISSKISEKYLNVWKNHKAKATEYLVDSRDLRNYEQEISKQQQRLNEKNEELSDLIKDLEKRKEDLQAFNNKYLDIQYEFSQYNNFCLFLDGIPENYFFLSKNQLSIIENDINQAVNKLIDLGIKIVSQKNPINKDNLKESNGNLFSICNNFKKLFESEKELTKSSANIDNSISNDIAILDQKIKELDEKLSGDCSDNEYYKLERELNNLREKRKKTETVNVRRILELFDKSVLNENNDDKLLQLIQENNKEIKTLIKTIKQKLENHIKQNKNVEDSKEIERNVNIIENKIKAKQEEIKELNSEIQAKRNTINNLCNKYNVSKEDLENRIIELHTENLTKINEDKTVEDSFGEILKNFKNKLDKHISDDKLMRIDKDNYFKNVYVKACNVIGITCTASQKALSDIDYTNSDVVIIDEVSKATPPELLISLMKAKKVILVGDHKQLPPTFDTNGRYYSDLKKEIEEMDDSDETVKKLKTLVTEENYNKYKKMFTDEMYFEEHYNNAPDSLKASLFTQFRMHRDIMNIINRFYNNQLKSGIPEDQDEIIKSHELNILSIKNTKFIVPNKHAYWIDSSKLPNGIPITENYEETNKSAYNILEKTMSIELVKKIAKKYKELGYPKEKNENGKKTKEKIDVAIISIYKMQVNELRGAIKQLKKDKNIDLSAINISVNTVDKFQGKERQIIIVNLVRNNNKESKSEHIRSYRRLNVAFSRAQNMLVILGAKDFYKNIDDVKVDNKTAPIYKNIMEQLSNKGCFFDSSTLIDSKLSEQINNEKKQISNNNYKGGKK